MKRHSLSREVAEEELVRLREAIGRVDEVIARLMQQREKYSAEMWVAESVLEDECASAPVEALR